MCDLFFENLNHLVSTTLCFVEFTHCPLMLFLDAAELEECLFEHIGELQSLCLVFVFIVVHKIEL